MYKLATLAVVAGHEPEKKKTILIVEIILVIASETCNRLPTEK